MNPTLPALTGYARADGRKGIRNLVVVAYLVECAHFVAREVAAQFRDQPVHLVGFAGCYPNTYAEQVMRELLTHPNVGAALLVSLGCESFDRAALAQAVAASGRPVHTVTIQQSGGTRRSVDEGREWVQWAL
ncbi:MAG: UxaA family hydrolase, partial [Burkholderiales bacterium]|nr:UxaA family hydrolase [Burkholderiales bacterium]